jgi:hypothetical protein
VRSPGVLIRFRLIWNAAPSRRRSERPNETTLQGPQPARRSHSARVPSAVSGIEAHVFNENAQSGVGQLPVSEACPEVWLADERDFARAEELISRVRFGTPRKWLTALPCLPGR